MTLFLTLFILLEIAFAVFLFKSGHVLWSVESVQASLGQYRQKPESRNLTQDWVLGWKFPLGQKMTEWMLKMYGDINVSRFYRFTGAFYFVVSPLFILAAFIHLRLIFLIG